MFEDEGDDDEEKGSLFGIKQAVTTNAAAPAAKTPALASQSSSPIEKSEEVEVSRTAGEDKPSEQEKSVAKTPEPLPSSPSPESSESKKKSAGAIGLFGSINALASKKAKSPLDEVDNDDGFLSKESPPPNVKKEERREEKVKTNAVSLFDEEEEDESDWNDPIFAPSKPTARNTLKVCVIYSEPTHSVKN